MLRLTTECRQDVSFIIVLQNYEFSGKPVDTMYTFDVEWHPCLLLGHNIIDIKALEAAQEKYKRTKARRQRMVDCSKCRDQYPV